MLIVDTYNALHVQGVLPPELAGLDTPGLARLIGISKWRRQKCRLICDGVPTSGRRAIGTPLNRDSPSVYRCEGAPMVEVVYAGAGKDADSLIEAVIEHHTAPRSLLVVSTDRRIAAAARKRRAKTMKSEAFLSRLALDYRRQGRRSAATGQPPSTPLDASQVEQWMDEFGVEKAPRVVDHADDEPAAAEPTADRPEPPDDEALILEALEEWPGRVDPDDLDMSRWLD